VRRIILITSSLWLALAFPEAVTANYFGPVDGCCRYADNAEHTINYHVVGNQTYRDAFDHAFNHLDNATLMSTRKVDSPNSPTDVRMVADYIGPVGLHGRWSCTDVNSAGECESGTLYLNRGDLDKSGQHAKDHTACHELGHSTGLDHSHSIDSCLEQGTSEPKWMSEHDKEHINDRYS
jgi:hypothetical protein